MEEPLGEDTDIYGRKAVSWTSRPSPEPHDMLGPTSTYDIKMVRSPYWNLDNRDGRTCSRPPAGRKYSATAYPTNTAIGKNKNAPRTKPTNETNTSGDRTRSLVTHT